MFTAQNDAYVNSGESPFLERRSSTHFPIKIPVKVKCHEANTSNLRVIKGETRDISEKGAGILTTHNIPTSAPLSIELDFSSVCPFFEIPFEIVWSDKNQKHETLQYGIAFRDQQQDKYDAIKKILERIQLDESGIKKENMVPRNRKSLNINEHVVVLQDWLTKQFKDQFPHLSSYSFEPGHVQRNVENFIGATQIPVGIGGPIKINGQYAQGNYYVPFATTEGTLVDTYHYGMMMITRSGGANVIVSDNRMDITPIFRFKDLTESQRFVSWVNEHFSEIKAEAEKTTSHGKLIEIKPLILGRRVLLNFSFDTADAMGMNIANIAADRAAKYITEHFNVEQYYLRSNFSSDKKPASINLLKPYGKEVLVDATIPQKILKRFYSITPEEVKDFFYCGSLGSIQCGMIGLNAHFANGLTAIYIACGQDVAQIVNASIGITILDITENGDLYISAKLPNLILGTVGGGTSLPTQQECLKIMGCFGNGKANKFAEIIAGTILAGEISIYAALTAGNFVDAHKKKRTM